MQVPFYFKNIVDSMNIDFLAIGGTAWTVAGSMIIACQLTGATSLRISDFPQMARLGLGLHCSKSCAMPCLQALRKRQFAESLAMSLITCSNWI